MRPPRRGQADFLSASAAELHRRGHARPDVLLISGDAYVDHHSFGAAVVGRLLESWGLAVAIAPQPDWRDSDALAAYGSPRLFIGVTAGNMDSMVNHMTSHRKRRHEDRYSPGGQHGLRPNRATVVYAHLARQAFSDRLILLGGVEASLRRFAHYDYWSDSIRRSVLVDSRADLLVFGMAERALRAICDRLDGLEQARRQDVRRLYGLRGTCMLVGDREAARLGLDLTEGEVIRFGPHGVEPSGPALPGAGLFRDSPRPVSWLVRRLPSHEAVTSDPKALAEATRLIERASNPALNTACIQRHGEALLIANPAAWPLSTPELDAVHELPFTRDPHPRHEGGVPAAEMIRTSIQITRGCFGGCSFCALALHEGCSVQSRSEASVLREVQRLQSHAAYRGTISDLGGPTANMWRLGCRDAERQASCQRASCLFPRRCPALGTDHGPLRGLMRSVREVPGVKHVHVTSGVRHDLALLDPGYLTDLIRHHVSGHLHVAPEHVDPDILRLARKPAHEVFERFCQAFETARKNEGVECYLNPYFISGLPGSTDENMRDLARYLGRAGWRPRQVQSFLPTPGSCATAMFYSGVNPDHPQQEVPMPRDLGHKIRQHAMITRALDPRPVSDRSRRGQRGKKR